MRRTAFAILSLGLLGYLLTGVTQVRPGERAVVRRLGRVVATPGPGLWVGFPAGIDRVERVAVDRVRQVAVGYVPDADESPQVTPPGQLLTGDHNLINIQVVLHYAVEDDRVEAYFVQQDNVEALIARAAEALLAEWVAGRTVDEVLLQGKLVLPELLRDGVRRRLDPYGLGIRLEGANVARILPPDDVKDAFDDVIRAQSGIRTAEQNARQSAAERLRTAQSDAYRIQRLADAYAGEQAALARAEAEAFTRRLEQYRRLRQDNPHVLSAIWWDETGRLFRRMKEKGRIDLLDNHLGADGLDITIAPPLPGKNNR